MQILRCLLDRRHGGCDIEIWIPDIIGDLETTEIELAAAGQTEDRSQLLERVDGAARLDEGLKRRVAGIERHEVEQRNPAVAHETIRVGETKQTRFVEIIYGIWAGLQELTYKRNQVVAVEQIDD